MKKTLILILVFIMLLPTLSFANTTNFTFIPDLGEAGKRATNEPIQIRSENGKFEDISYVISTTGGSSSIRYRTSEIRIVVAGNVYKLDTLDLQRLVPNAGETVHSMITISAQNIVDGINEERKRIGLPTLSKNEIDNIKSSLDDPSKIEIEATIDIYNKSTGKVLDKIRDVNDISKVAGKYGFAQKHMSDMESRFINKPLERVIIESQEEVPKNGLRPTGIRR